MAGVARERRRSNGRPARRGGIHADGSEGDCPYPPTWTCLDNAGPLTNMQSDVYWSGLEYVSPTSGFAWLFDFSNGDQYALYQSDEYYAVAVRPGDVAASVPEPQAFALSLLGLTALAVARRRRPR